MKKNLLLILMILISAWPLFAGLEEDLFYAVQENKTDSIKRILRSGTDINCVDINGMTPLLTALDFQQDAAARLLMEKGADLEKSDSRKKTALMYAAEKGNYEMMMLLLRNNADFRKISSDLESALSLAVNNGRYALAEILLDKGARLFHEEIESSLAESIFKIKGDMLDILSVEEQVSESWEPLSSIENNEYKKIRKMLNEGLDPNISDSMGLSLLMKAAVLDHPHIFELLLKNGADLYQKDDSGREASCYAAYAGNIRRYTYMKNQKLYTYYGEGNLLKNPLFYALLSGRKKMFKKLLEWGYPLEETDDNGYTLLHYAAFMGDLYSTALLMDAGAQWQAMASAGEDPLNAMLEGFTYSPRNPDYYSICKLFIEKGFNGRSYLVFTSDKAMIDVLLKR